MKVAAWQAPLSGTAAKDLIELIRQQIDRCEVEGVAVLCCPEAIIGGLADYADRPADIAINAETGDLERALAPLQSKTVTVLIGFTEITAAGSLYNSAAVLHRGTIEGIYRKQHPAIRRSVYAAGDRSLVFQIPGLTFGVLICNDSNFPEHAAEIAARGATALFILSNTALPSDRPDVAAETRLVDIALAAKYGLCVVRSDVAGRFGGMVSPGTSAIIDANGTVLNKASAFSEDLICSELRSEFKL